MVSIYVRKIRARQMKLDEVPDKWKEQVRLALAQS